MRLILLLTLVPLALLAQTATPNSAGVSMGHLHIICPDAEAQMKLWVDALGGKPVKVGPLDFVLFPGVLVGFRKGDSSGGTDGSIINHVGFQVRELAPVEAKLKAAGVQITHPSATAIFATLPGGVKVEVSEETALPMPVRFHHIHFATPQIEEMRAWYAKTFDAVPGMRARFKAADLPGVNLSWNPADSPTAPTKGRRLDHIGFEVTGIKAFSARLQASGIHFDMQPTERPDLGLTIAFITDPWGTRIELTEGLAKLK